MYLENDKKNALLGNCGNTHVTIGELKLLFSGDYLKSQCIRLTPHGTKRCQTFALNYICKLAGYTFNGQPGNFHNIFVHLKAPHAKYPLSDWADQ